MGLQRLVAHMDRNICGVAGDHFVVTVEERAEIEVMNLKWVSALAELLQEAVNYLALDLVEAFRNVAEASVRPSCHLDNVHMGPFAVDLDHVGALDAALVHVARAEEDHLHVDDVDIFVDVDASVNGDLACAGERA